MKDKLVTLIGGGGFLGRYVAQSLLRAGARVRIAQRDPRQAYFLKPLGGLGQTQFVAVDVARPDTVLRSVQGVDAVVNLVGVLAGDFQGVHVDGARAVAAAATQAGVEALVHVSAIGADAGSASAYGRSKGEGEAAARDAYPGAVILRPSIVVGPEDQFVNRFAQMIERAPVVPVLRSEAKFQPVFVGDVAEAITRAVAEPIRFAGQTYELGGPDVISMGALVRWINETTGRNRPIVEVPDAVGGLIARAGFLPGAPITMDQWKMLKSDNVVGESAQGLAAFDVPATPLDAVAPDYLVRYRRQGRFGRRAAVADA